MGKWQTSVSSALAALTLSCAATAGNLEATALTTVATDFTAVAKRAIPAVVSIRVKEISKSSQTDFDGDDEDLYGMPSWQRFFNLPKRDAAPKEQIGQASGFIVSADGYIITNSHVVQDSNEIIVTLNDGRELHAKAIGQDSNTDIALIKVEATGLPYLELANSDALEVGQWVVAIGTPLGLRASLTTGVVSAKGRNNLDLTRIEDFIQTDAALNRGNSGGPLLNLDSQVVGVNTAIASTMGGYMGIGFAVPSNIAKGVMEQLLNKGSVSRGFVGILLQPVDQNLAASFGLEKPEGILIAEVNKGSPAEKAGVKQGDIIVKYNGLDVKNSGSLRTAIALMAPGSMLTLSVIREGKLTEIPNIEIGEYSASVAAAQEPSSPAANFQDDRLGIFVGNLTPQLRQGLKLQADKGVVITGVKGNSIAGWAGLRKGMVILSVNHQPVDNVEQYQQALQKVAKDKPILFLLKDGEFTRYVSFKVNG